jgi:HK97 family phage major capsid protein
MTLAQQIDQKVNAAKAIQTAAKAENRDLSADELAQVGAHLDAAESLKATIASERAAAEAQSAVAARLASAESDLADLSKPLPRRLASTSATPLVAKEAVLEDPARGFKSFGDFALEILDCGPSRAAIESNPRLRAAAGTGMTQGVSSEGGVLVPPAFSREVWDRSRVKSESMLGYCDVLPIDPGVESLTISAINETSRANGSRWGGVQGKWKSELTQMAETRPALRDIKVEPKELYVLGYISDKLLRSAPGTASTLLATAAADEINFKIGDAIFNGDGAGKPRGVIGHTGTVSVAKETGQTAATVVTPNINKMWARCHANWRSGAAWFINQAVETELENLTMTVGTGGVPVYLPAGGVADTPNARLKGRPVIVVEYCAALGTKGDIVLGNFGAYLAAVRGMVDQSQSMHLKYDFAQTAFRFIFEIDGQPWMPSAITPYKGAATLSPFVTLDDRS